ncbi:hypothetical protein DRE_00722 [Drechslerella stenobrocha 248]|uniref:Peptidase metallopeptidase domain-containing protein n=1 Tax=Drechslerella stenobrocha 248 TaxID=1043628 RepID=W7HZE4_9PEZI|nr:hypothetical protein DRE_00722 [Drechslerella stenobrocha 248]
MSTDEEIVCHVYPAEGSGRKKRSADEDEDLNNARMEWSIGQAFTWKLQGPIQGLDLADMESAIGRALDKWVALTADNFKFTFAKATDDNYNMIIDVSGDDDEEFPELGGRSHIAAIARLGPSGSSNAFKAKLKFNDTKTRPTWNIFLFHNVFLHEIGHTFGLGHTTAKDGIMTGTYQSGMRPFTEDMGFNDADREKLGGFFSAQNKS